MSLRRRIRKLAVALKPLGAPTLRWVELAEDSSTVRQLAFEDGRVERPDGMTAADLPEGPFKVYIGFDPTEI